MNRRLLTLAAIGYLLSFALPANAAEMDCMEKAKGHSIIWNSAWGKDRKDNGTRYKVVGVEVYNRMPVRWVELSMLAQGRHSKQKRTFKVMTEEKARALCDSRVPVNTKLEFPGANTIANEEAKPLDTSLLGLPFIRFTREGWVRDEPPRREGLTTCRVLRNRFSCLLSEKEKFASALKELEEELRWRVGR